MSDRKDVDYSNWKIPCIVMTRVVGYFAVLDNFNEGQRLMQKDRKLFKVKGEDGMVARARKMA